MRTAEQQRHSALRVNRGGKGQGPSCREIKLADAMGMELHLVVATGKDPPFPRHYTIDVSDVQNRIAIEVDGPSHRLLSVQKSDRRKTRFLRSIGWHVFRVTNDDVDNRLEETAATLRAKISRVTRT